ncbi:thioester-containing protein 1 allele S1 isoform X2 [Drosophila virilis]|uniref:CD109 antigen n=1 Tax=Drosophila virilis TaxID=7244 RepID=A0A0Q9WLD1_DROVI|nr:CD109 antigen isoform X2 [Drosophila virilis]KRF85528.1 Thioester-containing protein 2, isoform G [Drosophila virilis]
MSRILVFYFCVFQLGLLVHATGLYTVIGPGTIRSNFKYNVAVSVHKAEGKSIIKVGITGPSYNETKQVELQPMSTTNVKFDVPKLVNGDYNLTAAGIEGVIFQNSTKLNYADNKPSIFIQSDKATYKPSDLVQFRVLFLDENTRPATIDKPITIAITDGAQNRIKQLTNVQLTKGVYAGELQLSEQPVLGMWSIAVDVAGETAESKSFEVAKYVLPKFEVIVESAKDVAVQDGVIKATIRAKYTYGKPVKGKATVSIEPNYSYFRPGDGDVNQMKTIDIDGKGHVEFPIQGSQYSSRYTPPLKIFAEVTEDLTGNKQNASTVVTLHAQRHKLEVVDPVPYYHPGKAFVYQFVVKNLDGSPVRDATKKAKLSFDLSQRFFVFDKHPTSTSSPETIEFEAPLNEHGIATFNVVLPESENRYLSVRGSYADSSSYLGSINKFQPTNESSEPLKIQVNSNTPKLGNEVSFDVKSNEHIPYFVYAIVARGNIVKSEHVQVPEGRKSYTVKFTPSFAMVPQSSIYVYYIFDNELRFEERTIDFDKDFENSIEISAPLDAKPSEEVKLKIKTDADSYVGLLGVDQSVLLLKSGNDLSRDDVFNSLNKYKTSTPWQQGYGRYPGQSSGLVTLTNANYPYNFELIQYYLRPFPIPFAGSPVSVMALGAPGRPGPPPRPPLSGSVPPGPAAAPQIRKEFPETWIFLNNITTDAEGFTLTKKMPDTITSWVVTGFSLNPVTGFALTPSPSKIRVFQPFFVSTNLPYSVKRGEVIAVPVIVFNYMDKALDAEVTMDNSDKEFEFTEATNEVEEKSIDAIKRVKRITIPSNNGQSVSFMIRPKKVGSITLKITATTPLAGDAIHQKLKVEPEGVTQFENKAVFVNLKNQSEMSQELKVIIPNEAVEDSEFIEFSVVGDLLGPTIKGLDNLVRMPYGCGEQNMVNFVPNILVVKYLEVTGRKMPNVVAKAKKFLEIGYQRELTYKHDDGSYSAFGKSDPSGSTWLTAYVVRSFHQAAKYTDVDPKVIVQGLDFLASKQKDNGEFPEVGKLFDNANQNALGLTSFVLIAFFENEEVISKYQETIDKALQYVAQEVDKTDDQYSLSISAVALQLAKHPQAKKILAKLQSVAKQEDGRKWWSKASEKPLTAAGGLTYWRPNSNDIEITSYVLMALLDEEPADASLPIIKWLIAQRNSNGGFTSTQDTVIGLQALTNFASKTGSGTGTIDIDFVSDNDSKGNIKVNPENSLVLQSHVLSKMTRNVNFTAKGQGSSMVQLSYRYNLAEKDKKPSFKVTPTVKDTPLQQLTLEVCAEYLPLEMNDQQKDSNMVVMEIALPSGYVGDTDSFEKIQAVDRVKRIETKNADSMVIVYFDSLTPGDVKCFPVEGVRAHSVAKQKPAAISLYDYYETDRRATEYYHVKSSLCDICEGTDCGEGCKKEN